MRTDCCQKKHPDHKNEINRLSRISGQVEGIKKMIVDNRYCPDILTQIKAVSAALKSLESTILETHLKACVVNAINSNDKEDQEKKIQEFLEIFKR